MSRYYDRARDSINSVVEAHRTLLALCPIDGRTETLIRLQHKALKEQCALMIEATEKFILHDIKQIQRRTEEKK